MVATNVKKVELSWDQFIDGNFPQPEPESLPRQIFRETLAEVAEQAKVNLPHSNGRIEKAVQIVLAGDIVPFEDGRFVVGAQSDTGNYIVLDNECTCKDFDNAPDGACKHVIATWLWRKTYPVAKARVEAQLDGPQHKEQGKSSNLPEAPASANVYIEIAGRKVQLTLRDHSEEQLLKRMEQLLARFPAEETGSTTPQEGWCSMHQVQMKLSKDGNGWYHKAGERENGKAIWCKGGR